MIRSLFLIAGVIFMSCNSSSENMPKQDSNVKEVSSDDAEMNAAIAKAKATIEQFDTAYKNGHFDSSTFYLKVRFQMGENGEHIWANHITAENGDYYGTIDEDAVYSDTVKAGKRVKINQENLSDWMYLDRRNVLQGGYTIKVLRGKLSPDEKAGFDSSSGFKIED